MAGWVCQTRKLLQSAIASIADELEQTVQNFNDAVHNLSKPATDVVENGEHAGNATPSDGARASEPAPRQDLEYDLAAAQMLDLCNQHTHCTDQDFFASPHSLPTTRQPETTGFATVLNSRLSQSSPSLYLPRRLESRSRSSELAQVDRTTGKGFKFQALAYRSTSPSSLTVSSPCLIHISRSARKKQSESRSIQMQYSEPEQCNIENRQTSKAEPSVCRSSLSSAGSPHNRADLSSSFGQKLPGKVIRAQRPLTPDELPKDDLCMPSQIFSDALTKPVPGNSSDLSPTDKEVDLEPENRRLAVVQSSVERETRFLRWLTLAPLTRVLSFAFTQFANVVLKLTEEECDRNQSPSQRELLAIADHAHSSTASSESPPIHMMLSRDSENGSQEQRHDLYTSLLRSTYSTESFEIIERSCFESLQDSSEVSVVHNLQTGQNFEPRSQRNKPPRVEASDILSSSAEFVNFDFKDLIADRQFDKLNPVPLKSAHGVLPRGNENMYKSYVVIAGDKGPDILVTYNKEDAVEENDGQNVDEREDNEDEYDDDDGSVSFTILSENDEDGYIMF